MSVTEFCYQVFQAYDFYKLYEEKRCRVQIGGQDQWGNMTSGLDLISKMCPDKPNCYAMTYPLLVDSQGNKIGKSTGGGNLFLDKDKTKPYDLYQYFMNLGDDDTLRLL